MSYCNSIFSILLDFMDDEKNKILSYKVVLYSILNPGGGIILASFALIPSVDCYRGIYNIKGIIIDIFWDKKSEINIKNKKVGIDIIINDTIVGLKLHGPNIKLFFIRI